MKFKIMIAIFIIVLIVSPIVAFFIQFDNGSGISTKQSDWASFATFYSGVLNPIISSIAFIGAISAILLQKKSIDQISKQLDAQDNESKKNDIIREINSCSKTIERFISLTLEPREFVILCDSIGLYDLPSNKQYIIDRAGSFNDINKELTSFPVWVGSLIATISHSSLSMPNPGEQHIKSKSKHIHGIIFSISANLDYFSVMLEKMDSVNIDPFFIKYNASKYYILCSQLHSIQFLKESTLNVISKFAESDV
ncbi:hypothetical protein [Pelagibaculum spongiae]|uniref:hypothetical protein n=1 Tax=Pelagibaculum spongiae TaxID=2080658 RepID=UPI0010576BE7|nr:hypothetical protein [Pelagibaculum spongiae]